MTKKQEAEKPKPRTQVKDLPKSEELLSKDEQKKVKGGSGDFYSYEGRRTNNQN